MELNLDEERERLMAVRTELMNRVTVLDQAMAALAGSNGAAPTRQADATPTGRRPMSAKAREAARRRMKAYWANKRREMKGKSK